MSNLARRADTGSGGTRVLLVRQPIRSVRSAHDANPLPVRLAVGVIVGVGVIVTLWLMGTLGYHLGFAPMLGLTALEQSTGGALIAATVGLMSVPMTILRTGIGQPMWLMLGFVVIAIPAAALGAVRPAAPGGPRPHVLTVTFSFAGAIVAGVFALASLWWTTSPLRHGLLQTMPASPQLMGTWLSDLRLAAAMDVFALVAVALWIVLVMRLSIPRWLRGLAAGITFSVLAIVLCAASMSNVAVGQAATPRTVAAMFEGATSEQVLLLGEVHGQLATMRAGPGHIALDLVEPPQRLRVVNRRSIVDFIADQQPDD